MAVTSCLHRLGLQGSRVKVARNQLSPRSLIQLLESAHTHVCEALHCSGIANASRARLCSSNGVESCKTHTHEVGHLGVGKQKRTYPRGNLTANASEGGAHPLNRTDQDRSQSQEDAAFMSEALEEARQVRIANLGVQYPAVLRSAAVVISSMKAALVFIAGSPAKRGAYWCSPCLRGEDHSESAQ